MNLRDFEHRACPECKKGSINKHRLAGRSCQACDGYKRVPTQRGREAHRWFESHFEFPAHKIEPGDKVNIPGVETNIMIAEAGPNANRALLTTRDKRHVIEPGEGLAWTTPTGALFFVLPTTIVLKVPSPQRRSEVLSAALARQATLPRT